MDILSKILTKTATLNDQEEALKDPWNAFEFALNVPGADIAKCQEVACKSPMEAYRFALHIEGANIEMSIEACKGTEFEDVMNRHVMNKALL